MEKSAVAVCIYSTTEAVLIGSVRLRRERVDGKVGTDTRGGLVHVSLTLSWRVST